MSAKCRYGVLGASRIARNKHVPAARESDCSEIVAVASRSQASAESWAQDTGVAKAYGSYQQLLDDSEIDAVINTLPNSMHCQWTLKALAAGKHVLCEKPLAMDAGEAAQMFDAAEKAGLVLMEGFITRFHPQLDIIRQIIDSGEIGPLRLMTAELVYPIGDWAGDSRAKLALGGGSLMDAGCYCTNIIRHIMAAEPLSVSGHCTMHAECGVDSSFVGALDFDDGVIATMISSMDAPFRVWCEITGTTGRIHVSSLFADSRITVTSGGKQRCHDVAIDNLFRRQLDHFSACVCFGQSPRLGRSESIGNAATLEAFRESARQMRVVHLANSLD